MIKYLNGGNKKYLTWSADYLKVIEWYVNVFLVHPNFKSCTGAIMTMGQSEMQSLSRGNKLNTRSSTEAEWVTVDDKSFFILSTVLFIEFQGYKIKITYCIKTTRVKLCWRLMVKVLMSQESGSWIFVIFLYGRSSLKRKCIDQIFSNR